MHVAGYIEQLMPNHSKPTGKQHLAAIRMLFDWLVTGQVIPLNPAHSVRGPKHSVKKGKTSVLSADEMRTLLDSIPVQRKDGKPILIGLRDRALIAVASSYMNPVPTRIDPSEIDKAVIHAKFRVDCPTLRAYKLDWLFGSKHYSTNLNALK